MMWMPAMKTLLMRGKADLETLAELVVRVEHRAVDLAVAELVGMAEAAVREIRVARAAMADLVELVRLAALVAAGELAQLVAPVAVVEPVRLVGPVAVVEPVRRAELEEAARAVGLALLLQLRGLVGCIRSAGAMREKLVMSLLLPPGRPPVTILAELVCRHHAPERKLPNASWERAVSATYARNSAKWTVIAAAPGLCAFR